MANKQTYLGEFEQLFLLSVLSLGEDAYGVTVRQHLASAIARDVSLGALYSTSERLERKGFITTRKGGAVAERGGKAKRYFKVTTEGIAALKTSKQQFDTLWQSAQLYQGVAL